MALNTSLSALQEHQIPGKLRKKCYVHGSLLSSQIGFNFLLARVVVPKDFTTCCVWAESRKRGIGFHLGVLSTQGTTRREQTIQHLSWRSQNSNVRQVFRLRQSPSCTQDQCLSTQMQTLTLPEPASRRAAVPPWAGVPPASLGARVYKEEEAEWCAHPYIVRFGSARACLTAVCKLKYLTQKGIFVLPGFLIPWTARYDYPPKSICPELSCVNIKPWGMPPTFSFPGVMSASGSPQALLGLTSVFVLHSTSQVVLCKADRAHGRIEIRHRCFSTT